MIDNAFNNEALAAHNRYRAMHGVPVLTLDQSLIQSAQRWAENLAAIRCMHHSDQANYGENLAYMGVTKETVFSGRDATEMWHSQMDMHDFRGEFTYETCYFTQMVWKSTRSVGFGRAVTADGCACYIVAHYAPKGNIPGQFSSNVFTVSVNVSESIFEPPTPSRPSTILPSIGETKEQRKQREKAEKKERERLEKERKEREKREKKEQKEREKLEKKEKRKWGRL